MRNTKRIVLLLFCFLILFSNTICVYSAENNEIAIGKEIPLPEDLAFKVNATCTDHVFFLQAAACPDGSFAVYSRTGKRYHPSSTDFRNVYIDIYDQNGVFQQELSFNTDSSLLVKLTEKTVKIYFYTNVLIFNRETQALKNYSVDRDAVINSGIFDSLKNEQFACGDWTYSCKKSLEGYTQLARSNENETQILVQMPGTGNTIWNTFLRGPLFGIAGIAVIVFLRKKWRKINHSIKDDTACS